MSIKFNTVFRITRFLKKFKKFSMIPKTGGDRKRSGPYFDRLSTMEKKLLDRVVTKNEPLTESVRAIYRAPKSKLRDLKYTEKGKFFRNAWLEYMEARGIPMEKLLGKVNSLLDAQKEVVRWDKEGNKRIHKTPDNTARLTAARMLLDRAAPVEKNVNIKHQSLKVNVNANVDTESIITKLKLIESKIREIDKEEGERRREATTSTERGEVVSDESVPRIISAAADSEAEGVGDEGSVHVQQGMPGVQGDETSAA